MDRRKARSGIDTAFEGVAADDLDTLVKRASALLARDDWLPALLAPLVAAASADPWFQPSFRVMRDRLRIGALLADTGAVSITACILSADALAAEPEPTRLVVPGRVSVIRYRGGPANLSDASASVSPLVALPDILIEDSLLTVIDGRVVAHLVADASADIVAVTATLRAGAAPYAREYASDDGRLLRMATLDDGGSRSAMLLTLLRLLGRDDAAAMFEQATHEPAHHLRWHAMREWLALDARAALPRLAAMADDPHPEVRAVARAALPKVEARLAFRA